MIKDVDINDSLELLKSARRANKRRQNGEGNEEYRIAVLGTDSTQYICQALKYILNINHGISATIYEGGYDSITKSVLDAMSDYYLFQPKACIMIPGTRDIKTLPPLMADNDLVDQLLQEYLSYYKKLWEEAAQTGAHVFMANFVVSPVCILGNLEANYRFSANAFIHEFNTVLIKERPNYVSLLDFDGLAANFGKNKWFDYTAFFTSKQGFHIDALGVVCDTIARSIAALYGKIRKCLVLDLDNTLWGGIVGDDGAMGINLDPNDLVGEAYRFFQQYILDLKKSGIILAICSKNDERIAKEPFLVNNDMLIKLDDISCFVANWDEKPQNLRIIANRLNIGIDSLVFFDDNPAERAIVTMQLPEVQVIDVPNDPAYYVKVLSDSGVFDRISLTKEDLTRSRFYTVSERTQVLSSYASYSDYLNGLEMKYAIDYLSESRIPRFAQLINKTNQFNLRTQRYSEAQISIMLSSNDYRLIYAELEDKYSNYGLISCVILKRNDCNFFVDTWVMSCRVFKRNVENKVFEFLINAAISEGIRYIKGEYIPTAKNTIVSDFFFSLGFEKHDSNNQWVYTL